ncbi:unnamed protein product [Rotaria sp. Silwood2]|nr:unnamed protein product [Rotaria sp. Silwood2]
MSKSAFLGCYIDKNEDNSNKFLKTPIFSYIFSHYCYICSTLFSQDERSDHIDHKYSESLNRKQLQQPCRHILQPLENKRSNAQFFFSQTFIDYLINKIIIKDSWDSIICIGCSTIFENLQKFLSIIKNCLILIDPPFGGFHRALSYSINKLFQS